MPKFLESFYMEFTFLEGQCQPDVTPEGYQDLCQSIGAPEEQEFKTMVKLETPDIECPFNEKYTFTYTEGELMVSSFNKYLCIKLVHFVIFVCVMSVF